MRTFALSVVALMGATLVTSAKDDAIQCANLIFAGTNTSRCFSDEFLSCVQRTSAIAPERRFRSVKLASSELFKYPFVVMTGESDFYFSKKERENLKKYLLSGGFLLASAGCSSKKFDASFRNELRSIFKERRLTKIPMDHVIFKTLFQIKDLKLSKSSGKAQLEGLTVNDKVVLVYSAEGLNDTAHTVGCCCCGGNEIQNSMEVNANILIYALTH